MGPTFQGKVRGAAAGVAAGAAGAGVWADAGVDEGAGVCAPAMSAIAIAAPAIDRSTTFTLKFIDTIPPEKVLNYAR